MQMEDLSGKIAVVTGGSRGMGRHIAAALHGAGASVAITGRDKATLAAAAKAVGARCRPYVCDQRDAGAIAHMAEAVLADLGPPDILVNNAGVYRGGCVVDMAPELWNEVIETNLTGVFLTTRAFLPAMIARGRGDYL